MADAAVPFFWDLWFWLFIISVSAFSIVFVWIILHFINPMKNSFARHIVKARRENKPVAILDAGKYFKVIVGEKKVGQEEFQIIRDGINVVKAGNVGGMKYCEGVLMGVGEDFRSLIANVAIVDLMELVEAKDWNPEEIKARLNKLEEYLKRDLGFTDDVKDVKQTFIRRVAEINARYNAQIEQVIRASYPSTPMPAAPVPETDPVPKPRGRPGRPRKPAEEDDFEGLKEDD